MSEPFDAPKYCEDCESLLTNEEEKIGKDAGYYLCTNCQRER